MKRILATIAGVLLAVNFWSVPGISTGLLAQQAPTESETPADETPAAPEALQGADVKNVIAEDTGAVQLACEALDEESGKPVAGGAVQITFDVYGQDADPADRAQLAQQQMHTKTDAKGRYIVPLPTWSQSRDDLHVRVEITHPKYLHYYDNKLIKDILARKDPPAAFRRAKLTEAREIAGRVVDPDGNGLPDVMLYKQYTKDSFIRGPEERDIRDNDSPRTDAEGRFRCKVAARGYVAIRYRTLPEFIEEPIEVSAERDQGDIRLSRGTRFTGQILTSEGKPLAGGYVSVKLDDANWAPNTECDDQGRFTTDAFGSGKHTVMVRWHGPAGTPRTPFVREPPELYLPVVMDLSGQEEQHEIIFRPIDHFECVAHLMSAPKPTGDLKELALVVPFIQARGLFQKHAWKGGEFDLNGDGKTARVLVPQGLTDVELSFGEIPQRVQRDKDAPLLFGGAMKVEKLDANLNDIRLYRYRPTAVKLHVDASVPPADLQVRAAYAREPEMRAAGMVFPNSEAAMTKTVAGADFTYSIVPDEVVRFTVSAKGFQSVVETLQLPEGESKALNVKLAK